MNRSLIPSKTTVVTTVFYVCLLVVVTPIIVRQIHANDIWKALYSGRYLTYFHHFPHHSTFSYSPVDDFLARDAYNWLGNLIFVGLHQLGGTIGLQFFRIFIALFTLGLLHEQTRFSKNPFILLILILVTYGISQKLRLRTAIFAVPFTLLLLRLWTHFDFKNDYRYLWGLPIVFLFWTNLHGSYIVGVGLLLALLLGEGLRNIKRLIDEENIRWKALGQLCLVTLLIMGTVTYVKPHPDYKISNTLGQLPQRLFSRPEVSSPLDSNFVQPTSDPYEDLDWFGILHKKLREAIAPASGFRSNEFESPFSNTEFGFVRANLVLGAILLALLLFFRLPYEYIPLIVVTVLLGITYLRSMPYIPLVLGSLFCVLYGRNEFPNWLDSSFIKRVSGFIVTVLGLSILVISSTGLNNLTHQYYHRFGFGKSPKFSGHLPHYVLTNLPRTRVANSFNTGTYLIWKWWPYKRVFLDSKSSAYSSRLWRAIERRGAISIFKENGIRWIIVEDNNPSQRQLMQYPRWHMTRHSGGLALFRYRDL